MLSKKAWIPIMALLSLGNALIPQNQSSVNLTQCQGNFIEQAYFLQLNCYDNQGGIMERYERLFTRPLEKECSEVSRSSIMQPSMMSSGSSNQTGGQNATNATTTNTTTTNTTTTNTTGGGSSNNATNFQVVGGNGTSTNGTSGGSNSTNGTSGGSGNGSSSNGTSGGDMVSCCDYFERGAGYEFSVCSGGIGAVILADRIGGARDLFWINQTQQTFLSPLWADLGNLIDNYCDARQNQSSSNSSSNSSGQNTTAILSSLNIPWSTWGQDIMNQFSDLTVWLSRYTQYIGVAQDYLNQNPNATLPALPANTSVPILSDLQNVSYGQLVTNYNAFYMGFVDWYNLLFGNDGLVTTNFTEVMDGQTRVREYSANVTSIQGGANTFHVEVPYNSIPFQFEQIAGWIGDKFGNVIVQNACNVCNSQNRTNSTSGGSGSNNTNTTGNSTTGGSGGTNNGTSTNGTQPTGNGTQTSGGGGSPVPLTNFTLPDGTVIFPDSTGTFTLPPGVTLPSNP